MQFVAKARYLRYSPYKLRPLADVVRGKNVAMALDWLSTHAVQRTVPVKKALESAAANAKNIHNLNTVDLIVKDIRVDQGPIYRYFKPGAMGRSNIYRKRFSHISIVLEPMHRKDA
jgi:large subunit ribosomal protein L22